MMDVDEQPVPLPASFIKESSQAFPLLPHPTTLTTYKHTASNLRVLFVPIQGPLCSLNILVPTQPVSDAGHPHTLEHLVFCGSRGYPDKGYLDTLATRCLSGGSNAYTAEDHTAYTITTAGGKGMVEVLPVFLDHVLRPGLTKEQFVTEVYHVDGNGKEQGVVFCEMAGRENTEADLLDLCIRRNLYKGTPYALECGGLTPDIRNLTNEAIRNYHNTQYHLDSITIVLCGVLDPHETLQRLASSGVLDHPELVEKNEAPLGAIVVPPLEASVITERIEFPSSDESVGSIAYAWRGPASEDLEAVLALEVVLRYLQNNAASPLNQAFVERPDPWASSVDFDVKSFVRTGVVLYFSGVPFREDEEGDEQVDGEDPVSDDGDEEWGDDEDEDNEEYDDDDDYDEDEDDGPEQRPTEDLFAPGVFREKLFHVLTKVQKTGIPPQELLPTIRRLRRKILEAGEEDPHELTMGYILPDIIRHHLAPSSGLNDAKHGSADAVPNIGSRGIAIKVLEDLAKRPVTFWGDVVGRWLIGTGVVEIFAVPSRVVAGRIAADEVERLKERREKVGEEGLKRFGETVSEAVLANRVDLPKSILEGLPAVPDLAELPRVSRKITGGMLEIEAKGSRRPFESYVTVETDTAFASLRLGLHAGAVPSELRPFLVMFQELIFESPLAIPKKDGSSVTVDYKKVVRSSFEAFVSFEAAFGFGNDLWSASWLSEVFMLGSTVEPETMFGKDDDGDGVVGGDEDGMGGTVLLLVQALLFTQFTKERIQVAIGKLLSDLTETKRDGSSMLAAVGTRIMSPTSSLNGGEVGNDVAISLFLQEGFLRDTLKSLKDPKALGKVVHALEAVREAIVFGGRGPGFLQVALPASMAKGDDGATAKVLRKVVGVWDRQVEIFQMRKSDPKRKKGKNVFGKKNGMAAARTVGSAFPFPRRPFGIEMVDLSFTRSLIVPISGITASYLSVTVPCDVLRSKDYFAVSLLADLLSRMEGPLYTSIRGRGFAYDATLHLALWTGQLSFEVHEASDPRAALVELFRILLELADDDEGFGRLVTKEHLETARAAVAFRIVEGRSCARGVVVSGLRSLLRGFASLDEEEEMDRELYAVTAEDLKVVFWKYFWQFLEPERRVVVVVTPEGDGVRRSIEQFGGDAGLTVPRSAASRPALNASVQLQRVSLKQLAV
ncbi:hypothetical protein HDU67_007782 [Dinochytrium kinnereticum]|nr:hypothetical protein HDU67_007782 [Dinochytrium kinnereticum]